jgi:hypothetical protein
MVIILTFANVEISRNDVVDGKLQRASILVDYVAIFLASIFYISQI